MTCETRTASKNRDDQPAPAETRDGWRFEILTGPLSPNEQAAWNAFIAGWEGAPHTTTHCPE